MMNNYTRCLLHGVMQLPAARGAIVDLLTGITNIVNRTIYVVLT